MKRTFNIFALFLLVILVAGCSDDNEVNTTTGNTTSTVKLFAQGIPISQADTTLASSAAGAKATELSRTSYVDLTQVTSTNQILWTKGDKVAILMVDPTNKSTSLSATAQDALGTSALTLFGGQ